MNGNGLSNFSDGETAREGLAPPQLNSFNSKFTQALIGRSKQRYIQLAYVATQLEPRNEAIILSPT
jgi:hypothetical protein